MVTVVPYLAHLPNLFLLDFHFFRAKKCQLNGWHFCTVDKVKDAVTVALKGITDSDLYQCFQELYNQWQKYVVLQEQCFVGSAV